MPERLIKFTNVDVAMIALNATSVGIIAIDWATEHFAGIGGFIVMVSVAILNLSKAYLNYKKGKNENNGENK